MSGVNSPKKSVTVYLVTNDEKQTRKVTIPYAYVKVFLFLVSFVLISLFAGFIDYFGLLAQSVENKKLKIENVSLRKQFQAVEGKLDSLQSALDRVGVMTNKLKLITDTHLQDRAERLSFPAQVNTANVDTKANAERLKNEEFYEEENGTEGMAPPNTLNGELATERSSANYNNLVVKIDETVKDSLLKEQSVIELWESLSSSQSLLAATPSIRPARGPIGSHFGYRIDPINGQMRMHAGLDFVVPSGTPVRATADGVVSFAGWDEFYGKLVSIDHGYGVLTRYAHNSQIYVQVGQKVSRYDVIAASGSTGRATGPHSHYEVRVNGVPVDPANYILDDE